MHGHTYGVLPIWDLPNTHLALTNCEALTNIAVADYYVQELQAAAMVPCRMTVYMYLKT